jgi:glutaredoxin
MKKHHEGANKKNKVLLYALSTCIWCKKTKEFLNKNNIDYVWIDVDLLNREEREKAELEMDGWVAWSFPLLVINDRDIIKGFDTEKLTEKLLK